MRSALAHERDGREAFGTVVEFAVAVAEVLHLEAVRLVLLVVEGVELVDGDLVELVEVRPPLPAAAEIVVEERVRALLAEFGCHIERAHRENVHTVSCDGAERGRDALDDARMHAWALRRGDVDAHAGAAEDERALKLLLGDHRANAKPDAVEHQFRVVRIGIGLHANVSDRPALLLKILPYGLLQRVTREVSRHQNLLVLYRLHTMQSFFLSSGCTNILLHSSTTAQYLYRQVKDVCDILPWT